jgi:DNA-directed RNA polymerase subunit RPC12/RpoP
MSATDELRELLDEHNIKWWSDSYFNTDRTEWVTEDGPAFMALDMGGRDLAVQIVRVLTPRRAIEATLGRTCHMRLTNLYSGSPHYVIYVCSECDAEAHRPIINEYGDSTPPKYCPECGRRVVE